MEWGQFRSGEWNGDNTGVRGWSGMGTIQEGGGMEWGQYRCEGMEWNGDNTGVRGRSGMGTIQV